MDAKSSNLDKQKLEEHTLPQLITLLKEAMERIKTLEKKLNDSLRISLRKASSQA